MSCGARSRGRFQGKIAEIEGEEQRSLQGLPGGLPAAVFLEELEGEGEFLGAGRAGEGPEVGEADAGGLVGGIQFEESSGGRAGPDRGRRGC